MTGGLNLDALARAVAAHGAVVRVVVARVRGSAPREAGAAMLVWAAGQSGTIGGGALEFEAARLARGLLEPAAAPWSRQLAQMPLGPALGQCCGGAVTLVLERFGAAEVAALAELRGSGHGAFRRSAASGEPPRSSRGDPRLAPDQDLQWTANVLAEPFAARAEPVWLYGAGHVGRAIVRVAEGLPLAITWVDMARGRFPEAIPPHVTPLVAAEPAHAVAHAPDAAWHLVMTHSHPLDLDICHAVLSRRFRHLGLIGSASKRARFLARLRALGHPEASLARLQCPIGDPSLGKAPAAIALGVVTALLRGVAAEDRRLAHRV